MSDQPGDEGDDQRWSSLIEAASSHRPIVPLPGTAPPILPVPESPRPAPIPGPMSARVPISRSTIPDGAAGAVSPPHAAPLVGPNPPESAIPEEADAAAPPDAVPTVEPEVPVALNHPEDAIVPAMAGVASRKAQRNGRLWLLAALLLACTLIAGVGLLQAMRHARKLSQVNRQIAATAEASVPPPVVEAQAAALAVPVSAEAEQTVAVPVHRQTAPAAMAPAPNPPAPVAERPVILYYRRASPAADRLAEELRPLAKQVDMRTATAIPRRPTIRYFQPEDAAAAQALATALGRDGGEWRVQDRTTRHRQHASNAVEVWLPDR